MSFSELWEQHRLLLYLLGASFLVGMLLLAGLLVTVQRLRDARRESTPTLAELEQYRLHLEDLVAARTRELEVAKEAAEASARAKSAFLANMSHEIRTPMNAVLGQTHLLRRATSDPRQLDRLVRIDEATRHLLTIIDDMLDLARIESERMHLETVDFMPAALIDEVTGVMRDKARAKGLDWQLEVASDLPDWLHGDSARLRQVLLNYASNAVKFTEHGGVTLVARCLPAVAGRCWLRFEVVDTGMGIDPDMRGRLFQAFEQADESMTRRYGGAGLGLAIVRRIAELLGGRAGVDSTPGAGSTFWFEAPFDAPAKTPEVDAVDTPPVVVPTVSPSADALPDLPGLNVNEGLASVAGKVASYRRLLGMLVDQHAADLELIRAALANGQREEARRLAHSLKGAAATLGAEPLRVAALAVEMAAKNDSDSAAMAACLDELDSRLNELLAGLRAYFAAPAAAAAPATSAAATDPDIQAVLQRLSAALEVDDLSANTLWLEHAARFERLLGESAPAIGTAIQRFDYAQALKLLRALVNH